MIRRYALYVLPLLILIGLVGFFWRGLYLNPSQIPSPLIDKPAPNFNLPRLDDAGRDISPEDLHGQPFLLNVWATWCAACKQEHTTLVQFAQDTGVTIVGLDYKDERKAARLWLEERGNPYTVVAFDADGRAALDWGVYGAPETFLVDADGVIRDKHIGPLTPDVLYGDWLPRLKKGGR